MGRVAHRWLRIRVELVAGHGDSLVPAPGRVMLVPPTATFADFALGVDVAFGRWDVTPSRSFRRAPAGRHERRRPERGPGEISLQSLVRDGVSRGSSFEYLFDDDEKWLHECLVEGFVSRSETQGRSQVTLPVLGWGSVPDQFGRTAHPEEHVETADEEGDRADIEVARPAGRRHRRAAPARVDIQAVRTARAGNDAAELLASVQGRDLAPVLQQVGDALARAYRSSEPEAQDSLRPTITLVVELLEQRQWEGDDVLSEELTALLDGSERRWRTLTVDIEELAEVMANGGEDPGGYLHLDTGEVVHAFLHHGFDDFTGDEADAEVDNLWIYVDHDDGAAWADMAAFAQAAPDGLSGILSVAIKGKGAFARFSRTVDELDLWNDWQVFADDRAFGRARALLRAQGIRPV